MNRYLLALMLVSSLLLGCGQKGPLLIPQQSVSDEKPDQQSQPSKELTTQRLSD